MADKKQDLMKKEAQTPTEVERTQDRKVFIPNVDIFQRGEDTILLADMPGVDEKSVDINLDKNILTISGTIEAKESENHKLVYSEYGLGDYERAFTLSNEIDADRIHATVKNGVLRLVLPKAESAKPKKITVAAG